MAVREANSDLSGIPSEILMEELNAVWGRGEGNGSGYGQNKTDLKK